MSQIKTRFSIQDHWQKKNRSSHFDLRILDPKNTILWSWAFPKSRFPEQGEKVLAIRTPNHRVSYMYFQGNLQNGDKVKVYDRGKCRILLYSHNLIVAYFNGNKTKGIYNFIRLVKSKDSWLVTKSNKSIDLPQGVK